MNIAAFRNTVRQSLSIGNVWASLVVLAGFIIFIVCPHLGCFVGAPECVRHAECAFACHAGLCIDPPGEDEYDTDGTDGTEDAPSDAEEPEEPEDATEDVNHAAIDADATREVRPDTSEDAPPDDADPADEGDAEIAPNEDATLDDADDEDEAGDESGDDETDEEAPQ